MSDLALALKISADTSQAQSAIKKFGDEFNKALLASGKTQAQADDFYKLVAAVNKGTQSLSQLSQEQQKLIAEFQQGSQLANASDFLGLSKYKQLQSEIHQTTAAFAALEKSGTLSQKELAAAAQLTATKIQGLQQSLTQLTGNTASINEIATALTSIGTSAGGLTAAAKEAISFETSLINVTKTTDLTKEATNALGEELKALSMKTPVSPEALADIAALGGSLGISKDKLLEFTQLVSTMSTAFDMPAKDAAEALATLSTTMNLSLKDARDLGDAINVLGNNTNTTEKKITEVLSSISGMSQMFGLSSKEAAALSATFLSLGETPETAATAINALLSALQTASTGTDEFKNALADLGYSADEIAQSIADNPQKTLTEFIQKLSSLDKIQKPVILTELFGAEYQDNISKITGNVDLYQKSLAMTSDTTLTAGAMQKEYTTKLESTQSQIDLVANTVKVLGINLGTLLLPSIQSTTAGMKSLTEGIASFVSEHPHIAKIGEVLLGVGTSVAALNLAFKGLSVAASAANISGVLSQANKSIGDMITSAGLLKTAFNTAGAALAAWEIGTEVGDWLLQNTTWAKELGETLAKVVTYGWESVTHAAILFKDYMLGDFRGVHAEMDRHKTALADLKNGWDFVSQSASKSSTQVAQSHKEIGSSGLQAGVDVQTGMQQAQDGLEETATAAALMSNAIREALKTPDKEFKLVEVDNILAQNKALQSQYDALIKSATASQGLALANGDMKQAVELATTIQQTQVEASQKQTAQLNLAAAEAEKYVAKTQEIVVEDGKFAEGESALLDQLQQTAQGLRAQAKDSDLNTKALLSAGQATGATKAALEALGITLSGVSKNTQETLTHIKLLGEQGLLTGENLNQAFANAIQSAKTITDLQAIAAVMEEMGQKGQASSSQVATGYDLIHEKLVQLKPSQDAVTEATNRATEAGISNAEATGRQKVAMDAYDVSVKTTTITKEEQRAATERSKAAQQAHSEAVRQAAEAEKIHQKEIEETTQLLESQGQKMSSWDSQWNKFRADIAKRNIESTKEESQQFTSHWSEAYERVKEYNEGFAQDLLLANRGEAYFDSTFKSIDRADQAALGFADGVKKAQEAIGQFNTNDIDELRDAIRDAETGLYDVSGVKFQPLRDEIDKAKDKVRELRSEAAKEITAKQKVEVLVDKESVQKANKIFDSSAKDISKQFSSTINKTSGNFKKMVENAKRVLQEYVSGIGNTTQLTTSDISRMVSAAQSSLTSSLSGMGASAQDVEEALKQAMSEVMGLSTQTSSNMASEASKAAGEVADSIDAAATKAGSSLERMANSADGTIDGIAGSLGSAAMKAGNDILTGLNSGAAAAAGYTAEAVRQMTAELDGANKQRAAQTVMLLNSALTSFSEDYADAQDVYLESMAQNADNAAEKILDAENKLAEGTAEAHAQAAESIREENKKTNDAILDAAKELKDSLAAAAKDYANEIQSIQDKAKDFALSISDSIRDIQRSGMSAADQRLDKINEFNEGLRNATALANQGDVSAAIQGRDRLLQLARDIAKASSDDADAQAQARSDSIAALQRVGELNKTITAQELKTAQKEYQDKVAATNAVHANEIDNIKAETNERINAIKEDESNRIESLKLVHRETLKTIEKEKEAKKKAIREVFYDSMKGPLKDMYRVMDAMTDVGLPILPSLKKFQQAFNVYGGEIESWFSRLEGVAGGSWSMKLPDLESNFGAVSSAAVDAIYGLNSLGESSTQASDKMQDMSQSAIKTGDTTDYAAMQTEKLGSELGKTGDTTDYAAMQAERLGSVLGKTGDTTDYASMKMERLGSVLGETGDTTDYASMKMERLGSVLGETGDTTTFASKMERLRSELGKTGDTTTFASKMERLRSELGKTGDTTDYAAMQAERLGSVLGETGDTTDYASMKMERLGSVLGETGDTLESLIRRMKLAALTQTGSSSTLPGFSEGGVVDPSNLPARGVGDTIPVWTRPGEAFLVPEAVQMLGGKQGIDAINAGRMPDIARLSNWQFNSDLTPKPSLPMTTSSPSDEIVVRFEIGGVSAPARMPNTDATKALLKALKQSKSVSV